jgi:MFS family permease
VTETFAPKPRPAKVVTFLGIAQIFGWGTSFYFPAVLAAPIVADTGWPLGGVVAGLSIGLMVAGLISPLVGRAIERHGGRPILIASSFLFAAGLSAIALAPNLPVYWLAWGVVGLGMGTGLYDAVFAALGTIYGKDARAPITNLTLFGGFASTVCWPLGALLVDAYGWRTTSLVYAATHLCICLPALLAAIPRKGRIPAAAAATTLRHDPAPARSPPRLSPPQRLQFVLLAMLLTISAGIGSIVIVHLLIFLQERGIAFALAVSLGTLFGPSQVAARVIESLFGRYYHPIWTMVASCGLMAVGLVLLLMDGPVVALAILLYGGGYGIMWIARGTLPLALFGPQGYASLIGRLALPSLIAQALAPSAGAVLLEQTNATVTIAVLAVFAVLNLALMAGLWAAWRRPASEP